MIDIHIYNVTNEIIWQTNVSILTFICKGFCHDSAHVYGTLLSTKGFTGRSLFSRHRPFLRKEPLAVRKDNNIFYDLTFYQNCGKIGRPQYATKTFQLRQIIF